MWRCVGAAILVAAGGCTSVHGSQSPQICVAPVQGFADPQAGSRGDFRSNVDFADVPISSDDIGYGATAGRGDEITIADGAVHLARPDGPQGYRQRLRPDAREGAYMLQLVKVRAWRAEVALPSIESLDVLGASIAEHARSVGCGAEAKLAYRIVGRAKRAEWSLDTLPRRGEYVTEGEPLVVVGLFATQDQARHFVPEGRSIHAHAVFSALGVAGHLKALELEPGARLQIQAR